MSNTQLQLRKFNEMVYADSNSKYTQNNKGGQILTLTDG